MIKRVVEVGSDCQLSVSNGQLILKRIPPLVPPPAEGEVIGKVPLEDLGVLVLDNAMITYTLQLLQQCAEHKVAVIFCNNRHLPESLLQPLAGHSLHSRTLAEQVKVSEPIKKRLWQQIVMGKIQAQALTLEGAGVDAGAVRACAQRVKSGDADNQESQAARLYWGLLFGEGFRRRPQSAADSPPTPLSPPVNGGERGINTLLNYGYAVVRAAVARWIVGTGLHPAIGIHHHNQYDAFCLADDLMEPFRPAVDFLVWRLLGGTPPLLPAVDGGEILNKETKRKLLEIFETSWRYGGKHQPFMVAVPLYVAAVKAYLFGGGRRLEIPRIVERSGDERADGIRGL